MNFGEGVALTHREIIIEEIPVHVVEAGTTSKPAIFFIHGWPTCWREFEAVLTILSDMYHVVAIDIPGIGNSIIPMQSYSKRHIAEYLHGVIEAMNLQDVTLVGCDCGGQIVYAYMKNFQRGISRAVIMNVAIPGVKPWDDVKSNPYVWHFRFHLIPELPEKLVAGKELLYFSYFFDILSGRGRKMSDDYRNSFAAAYARPEALKAGFDFYRNFTDDEKDNILSRETLVSKPVLYLRGGDEYIKIDTYMNGFRENGFTNIEPVIIENCGHFSAEEQPDKVSAAIRDFIRKNP